MVWYLFDRNRCLRLGVPIHRFGIRFFDLHRVFHAFRDFLFDRLCHRIEYQNK